MKEVGGIGRTGYNIVIFSQSKVTYINTLNRMISLYHINLGSSYSTARGRVAPPSYHAWVALAGHLSHGPM